MEPHQLDQNEQNPSEYRVLELFSGIGGMHYAIRRSGKPFRVVAAMEINPVANTIYNHNFGPGAAHNSNILSLTPERIDQLGADVILMSPPCQPFTRNGHFKDVEDRRADPFVHLCDLLDKIPQVRFVLLENVKGFERSQACEQYKVRLTAADFFFREFILSPHDYGVPNTRHRYYCVAKEHQPDDGDHLSRYLLKPDLLRKRLAIMDVCTPDSRNSMCFTKAYTHYAEGTGSVYSPLTREEFDRIYAQIGLAEDAEEQDRLRASLKVRYFTPKEVARLMSFPGDFGFPKGTTDKQCYRVLGNSINVLVVSSLFDEME
ncbi:hypothetical protein quinque_015374 [Culex quinquefasciatus]